MEIEELKVFLKIDGTDDDPIIESLQIAAEEYLINAGVTKIYDNKLYCLAIKLLVSHWYENRNIQSEKNISKLSFSLDSIILQLKLQDATESSQVSTQEEGSLNG